MLVVNDLFERITSSEAINFKLKFSYLEIYNEKVQDLLIDVQGRN